ncbi:hypothetical protein ACYOEI_18565 [Singulisphaera rosea]
MPDEHGVNESNEVTAHSLVEEAAPSSKQVRCRVDPRVLHNPRCSLSIELSPEALNVFNQILNMTNDASNDVIRKAISLYRVALEAHQQEKAIGSASTPAVLDTEFVGF